ncbi:MAG: sulfatase-like hydrolase/transferase [Planctomycetales bacterium]|nr:sulfatase-like hydrolase/transferase [Planctomycetales bacterium]MCA9183168.1 sulfatase-like hydrolase/transferase [Planctomycetales bacterium]
MKSLRYVHLVLCLSLLSIHSLVPCWSQDASQPQPNILLLLADDQSFDTIAALGNSEVITPNLDRLARRGTSFSNAYNMGGWNGAICLASRAMFNTGRFVWRARAVDNALEQEAQAGRLLPCMLRQAGYETFMSGKWHIAISADKIYDHAVHVRPGMPRTVESSYQRGGDKGDWTPWDTRLGGYWEGGKHWSEVLADDAKTFLDISAKSDRPFFMYLAFNAPHDPRQAPREFVERYDRKKIKIPANFLPQHPYMEAMGAGRSLRDERLAPWPRTPRAVQLHRQEYYALITHMDQQIGRILDELERTGQGDNTYIVMTADHGLACGQHGLLGKQNMYEHSLKAPLIVVGPDIPAEKRIDTPVYVQDFVATALEWAQAPQSEHVEFKSLLPLIRGESTQQYELIYGAYEQDKQRMVRRGDMKLIHYPAVGKYEMYNLKHDPLELHDLSQVTELARTLNELKADMRTIMRSMDDPLLSNNL